MVLTSADEDTNNKEGDIAKPLQASDVIGTQQEETNTKRTVIEDITITSDDDDGEDSAKEKIDDNYMYIAHTVPIAAQKTPEMDIENTNSPKTTSTLRATDCQTQTVYVPSPC